MKRTVVAIAVGLAVLVAGILVYAGTRNDSADRAAAPATPRFSPPTGAEQPAVVMPSISVPAGSEEAGRIAEMSRLAFELSQEIAKMPKDQRPSAEEIKALLKARAEELEGRP